MFGIEVICIKVLRLEQRVNEYYDFISYRKGFHRNIRLLVYIAFSLLLLKNLFYEEL